MAKRELGAALVITVLLGVPAVAVWLGGQPATAASSEGGPSSVPVTAEKASTRDMPVYVRGLGTVQAYNSVSIKSRVDGQIIKVDFKEGQEVKAGNLLFEIDPRPFEAALAQAQAAKQKDQASLIDAMADMKRDTALLANDFQTHQAYDQQKALVGTLQAGIAGDQAAIETAQLNLQYADIRAPIDGRTGQRLVDIGNLVHATDNTALVTIQQIRPIFVSFTEPQSAFEAIRTSQESAPITAEALTPDDNKMLAQGTVSLIDNQIDQSSGTIHLKAEFANAQETLWPGEFVNVRLIVNTLKNAVAVAAQAVQQGPDGAYVFVVKPDMTVEARLVTVAETEDNLAVITKGVAPGETVVDDGQYRLDEGTRVSLQQSSSAGG